MHGSGEPSFNSNSQIVVKLTSTDLGLSIDLPRSTEIGADVPDRSDAMGGCRRLGKRGWLFTV